MSRTVQYQLHGSAGRAAGVWHQRINWEIVRREMCMRSETSTVFPVRHSEGARGPWLLVAPTHKRVLLDESRISEIPGNPWQS